MNKKGFTLIELLGVVTILGVIMLIAVPSVTSIIDRNKKETFVEDAKRFVGLVDYQIMGSYIKTPKPTDTVIVKLSYVDTSNLDTDPDGVKYDRDRSFVAVTINDGMYNYYVTLVSVKEDGSNRGVELINSSLLYNSNKATYVKRDLPNYLQGKNVSSSITLDKNYTISNIYKK